MVHSRQPRSAPCFRGALLKITILIALLSGGNVCFAQSNVTGSIYGSAPSGTASVTVTSTNTGVEVTAAPGADGSFRIISLAPGVYTVTVKREGQPDLTRQAVVRIGTGTPVAFAEGDDTDSVQLETFVVSGAAIAPIDMSSVETAVNFGETQLDRLPIARDLTSVALLAPGTVLGDSAFGPLASFGGSSVGENVYYFNGFNITNFRTGLGFANIPFEFFSDFQVKTSGYGAEFGRSTGGVVNSTSKSGGATWSFGGNTYWEPDALREQSPSARYISSDGDELYLTNNSVDEQETLFANVYASGPIIKDRLFIYALGQFQKESSQFGSNDLVDDFTTFDRSRDNPFYGLKLDGIIAPGHTVELTYFKNEDEVTDVADDGLDSRIFELGGDGTIARYTGQITGSFSISALYGESSQLDTTTIGAPATSVFARGSSIGTVGLSPISIIDNNDDQRKAYRIDGEWHLFDHRVRFGYDNETNSVANNDLLPGSSSLTLNGLDPGAPQRYIYASDLTFVTADNYLNVGDFETQTDAVYAEDTWQINNRWTVYAGLRNETFDNKNVAGESFINVDNQLAPRLGAAFDVLGEGRSKLFANYGRYYIPVATNTNIRLAGGELYLRGRYYIDPADPYDAAGVPNVIDPDPFAFVTYADGQPIPTASSVDSELEPQYQDEYVLGFQMDFGNRWQGTATFIHRDLKSTLEDIAIDAGLQRYADENGYGDLGLGGFDYYVLTNPGTDVSIEVDLDEDGVLDPVTLTAQQLGYPKAERYYNAVDLSFERLFDGKWTVQGSYTWSQSYGNVEGYVRSDNGQDDAGLTTAFDQPGLTDGAYGFLPNDRRHKFKLFGAYAITPEVDLGTNIYVQSGRPINAFGNHPTDDFAFAYGSESFYDNGVLVPRGSRGRTSWVYNLDLSARYQPLRIKGLVLGLDIFNVLNGDAETEVFELAEPDYEPGTADPRYKLPTAYQAPRRVRLSLEYDFYL